MLHNDPSSELSTQSGVPSHTKSILIHSSLVHCHSPCPHGAAGGLVEALCVCLFKYSLCARVKLNY